MLTFDPSKDPQIDPKLHDMLDRKFSQMSTAEIVTWLRTTTFRMSRSKGINTVPFIMDGGGAEDATAAMIKNLPVQTYSIEGIQPARENLYDFLSKNDGNVLVIPVFDLTKPVTWVGEFRWNIQVTQSNGLILFNYRYIIF